MMSQQVCLAIKVLQLSMGYLTVVCIADNQRPLSIDNVQRHSAVVSFTCAVKQMLCTSVIERFFPFRCAHNDNVDHAGFNFLAFIVYIYLPAVNSYFRYS